MPKLTNEEFILLCMRVSVGTLEGVEQLKELTTWLSQQMSEKQIPIHLAVSAFALLTTTAREAGERIMTKEGADAIH